jgi:putative DNA methylase
VDAGLGLTGTWPVRTERDARSRGIGSNALASSIVLVCRPRLDEAVTIARKDFLRQLERALPAALTEMTADPEAAVAPVDLAQAAIGPGMAIFSRYKAVLEADGQPMSVHNALIHINKAIDSFFAQAEGDLDADTRFCIDWFQQRGFETGPFGEADVLARAKGTAVDGVEEAGVLSASKGKVRLLRVKEYPRNWDPRRDSRVPVWEACHQMCRALGESEQDAGTLLARMPEKQDGIRQLAYRLYTVCERQKWAEEARLYNELITSWPAIVEESHRVGHKGTQLDLL